jgi:hypothetical protein
LTKSCCRAVAPVVAVPPVVVVTPVVLEDEACDGVVE